MSPIGYRQLADELRAAILRGEIAVGATIPKLTELAARYDVAVLTARRAVAVLESEGLVEAVRRRGTVVRAQPLRSPVRRDRTVYRDERGYYFDAAAQPWVAVEIPTVSWGPVPADIAVLLHVPAGSEVLIRDRVMGQPDGRALQLATSYLPADLARGTILEQPDTGPGGIYDRLEEMGHVPLRWSESLGARMPSHHEAAILGLAPGIPLLRLVRTTTSSGGSRVEVNDTRMSAALFEISYPLRRHPDARPSARPDDSS
jgi:GntR family transcriptional regulator